MAECPAFELLGKSKQQKYGWLAKLTTDSSEKNSGKLIAALKTRIKKRKTWVKFFAILHERKLYLYVDDMALKADKVFDMENYHSITKDDDQFADRFCFRILSLGPHKSLFFCAVNDDDLKTWMEALKLALATAEDAEKKALEWLDNEDKKLIERSNSGSKLAAIGAKLKNLRTKYKKNRYSQSGNASGAESEYESDVDEQSTTEPVTVTEPYQVYASPSVEEIATKEVTVKEKYTVLETADPEKDDDDATSRLGKDAPTRIPSKLQIESKHSLAFVAYFLVVLLAIGWQFRSQLQDSYFELVYSLNKV